MPPQQAPLPPAPGKLQLKQGYFPGKDGVQLFYRIVGSGKDTIVFVHGGPIGIEDGALDMEVIAERGYTFIAFDQRGVARSELVRDTTKLGIDSYVDDLEALRRFFGISKLSLIGLSWGSGVSSFYAYKYPNHVERMALISPMWTTPQDRAERWAKIKSVLGPEVALKTKVVDSLWYVAKDDQIQAVWKTYDSLQLPYAVIDPSHLDRARGTIHTYSPKALRNVDIAWKYAWGPVGNFRPMLKQIQVPTVVIEGEQTIVSKEAIKQYIYNMPNAKMVWIPDAGHMFWLDQPKAALDALDNFFKSIRN
ncbi:hypothetical protein GCM10023187_17810 [Nibrella viscosa]|uniref:AB hydrolase-1 domain-containing protein n=1 Tax=Nibrella viscosa TaxID=1084524 RepID=A0ABP8K9X8_9BACT